jgi:HEAT repeat protein
MGDKAIPTIRASIKIGSPWYYLRNIAYILGHIGNENSVDILQPLLLHKEKRVSKEALKSINQTGGNKRGMVLLAVLPEIDPELRVNVIETLGRIKCAEAVTDLVDMLKVKTSIAKDGQISLQEKICNTLGAIASPEAIKALSEIAGSKSILGIGSYSKEVKHAAENALAYVRRKQ